MEFTLLGAVAVAVLSGYAVLRFEAGRTNAADCTRDVWDAAVTAVVVGLVVGRIAAMIGAGTNPFTNPADLLIVRGGVDTIAATIAGVGVYAWMVRPEVLRMADAGAPAAVAGLAGWHAGCTVRDACLGTTTDLPWAVTGPAGLGRHPVEIYAAILLIVVVIGLILWKRRRSRAGVVAGVAMAAAAVVRAITEPLRPGLGSDLAAWYWAAAVLAAVLVVSSTRRRANGDGD